ncbi:pseudouridine synthase [Periconia macrospinosa]|uniref:tRNA pseudouridine(55) synthase n=1 Tax=Periconia macrospinosa TaxID=97972 RepID=A0A2V1E9K8_9PLEO|nr:pseudouridine synthase [Periconia macrospinosa]
MANLGVLPQVNNDHEDHVDEAVQTISSLAGIGPSTMSTEPILEGVFAISKPTTKTTPQILLDLQSIFASSTIFAPLLNDIRRKRAEQESHQPAGQKLKDEERDGRFFKLGHGGTLDPMASGVLIVGIGRGTKHLSKYLDSTKTYETVVLFGLSTTTYDIEGDEIARAPTTHITPELIRDKLTTTFMGTFRQVPPIYSGLKVDGMKAVEYARQGKELPRNLVDREVQVHECELLDFMPPGTHDIHYPPPQNEQEANENRETHDTIQIAVSSLPAAKIRLTVSSGFYVRSFAHDLGIACGSVATMASLHRSGQADFYTPPFPSSSSSSSSQPPNDTTTTPTVPTTSSPPTIPTIPYETLTTLDESEWSSQLSNTLLAWMKQNPPRDNKARGPGRKARDKDIVRQRFRGEWLAGTKRERILQQGGKVKGRLSKKGRGKNGDLGAGDERKE